VNISKIKSMNLKEIVRLGIKQACRGEIVNLRRVTCL
jgi:hypothetical protein